jgi:hypothetical protein
VNVFVRRAAGVVSAGLVATGLAACQLQDPGAPEQAGPVATVVAPATPATPRPNGSPGTWHLVFNSTFTGGALNRSGITHAPLYLILNNATTHLHQVPLQVPADMRVAYVRVWQHPGQVAG